jgi:hypothetical protein
LGGDAGTVPVREPEPAPVTVAVSPARRHVTTTPNADGLIELGPQADASGLGDTLAITPLAKRLGSRAVMLLTSEMERFAPLFEGLCATRVVADPPVFPDVGARFVDSKLVMFGFNDFEPERVTPVVALTELERRWAAMHLAGKLSKRKLPPVVLHTSCAARWAHQRSRPVEWWGPVREALAKRFTVLEYDAKVPLRRLAAVLERVGRYCGVNTGVWHLAMAVGCRCVCVDADACEGYDPALWRYDLPERVDYVGFDTANIIGKLPFLSP